MQKLDTKTAFFLFFGILLCSAFGFAQDDDNGTDEVENDTYSKIRLGFYAPNNFHTQILLGFQNENATDGIDYGYDAINTFDLPNDIYFWCANTPLSIQGVGSFNTNNCYPLGVKSNTSGIIKINLDAIQNMSTSQNIYIYDSLMDTYTNLKTGNFTATVSAGTTNDRFSLKFVDQSTLGIDNPELNNKLSVSYVNSERSLYINNTLNNTLASNVNIFNINGQIVASWNIAKMNQANLNLPVSGLSKGIYIVNVATDKGMITKKISI